jgi:hypothetical protein
MGSPLTVTPGPGQPPGHWTTFAEVAAHLSKIYITPYQGAVRWSAFFRFKGTSGSSGKEVKQP